MAGTAGGEVSRKVIDYVPRVVFGAVNERRLAAAEDRQADRIQPRRSDDAAIMLQTALRIDDGNIEPPIVGAEARGPDDRRDLAAAQIEGKS